jgi:hypothetical protein
MNAHLQNSEGLIAKRLPDNGKFYSQINAAGMAELVDARDLKFPATSDLAQISCKTSDFGPALLGANPNRLQNILEGAA